MNAPTRVTNHHTWSSDRDVLDKQGITRYHKSWAYNGHIIKEVDARKLIDQGKKVKFPWRDCGYHFVIEKVNGIYEVIMGRSLDQEGSHVRGFNDRNIGIAWVGNYDLASPSEEMWKVGVNLNLSLVKVFNIALSEVKGHNFYDSSKTCPGKKFDMEKLRDDITRMMIKELSSSSKSER